MKKNQPNHKKKIVQLARWYAPHIGGVETHVAQLNKRLLADGHQVTVLCEQDSVTQSLADTIDGVQVIRLSASASSDKFATWSWIWQQRSILQSADIVQVHDVFWWLWPLWPVVHKKVFTTFHGWETTYPIPIANKFQRWLVAQASKKTMHVGDWIQEFYWDKPDLVTYGGVDFASLPKSVKRSSKQITQTKKSKKLSIAFIGRLSPENEVLGYIETIKQLQKTHAVLVTWIGDGPLRAQCQQVGTVTGMVDDPLPQLKSADFVFASSYLSMLSAQALGKVVCSLYSHRLKQRYLETYPGREQVMLSDNAQQLAELISNIRQHPDHQAEIEQAATSFAQTQSWQRVYQLYQQLWGATL